MKNGLKLVFVLLCLVLSAGCGGGGDDGQSSSSSSSSGTASSSGSSGGGSSASSSSSGTSTSSGEAGAGGSSSSSSTSSSGEVCHPSPSDPLVQQCAPDAQCECNPTDTTEQSWCDAWAEYDIHICPEGANICSPGHNQCGYDLPKGEDYVLPDEECKKYINGDVWVDEKANQDYATSKYNENGQLYAGGLAHLKAPFVDYFSGWIVTGKKIVWNRANRDAYESAEGEFSADCKTITARYFKGGKGDEIQPYLTKTIVWLHHNQQ